MTEPAPFSLLDKADLSLKALALLVGVAGLVTYCHERSVERVRQSFATYERASEGRKLVASEALAQLFYRLQDDVFAQIADGSLPEAQVETAYRAAIVGALTTDPYRIHYDVMLAYYEGARLCVANHACDGPTLRRLLAEPALREYLNVAPELDPRVAAAVDRGQERAEAPGPGLGLRCFARQVTAPNLCFSGY